MLSGTVKKSFIMWSVFNRNVIKKAYNVNARKISSCIDISEEVKHALQNNLPTVALESTIITHGMPYPNNMECAQKVEKTVRDRGAIPATIAILDGRIKVGLSASQLTGLADTEKRKAIKTSRRDFGYVLANKLNGGTTVAGALIVAREVGIEVFATGGLGGVHREASQTFDISADLIELGKSPVAVVSSGVKSILDIPKTLEYLETQGVFVATFGEDKAFPAFYCRTSNCDAPYNVTSAFEAANVIKNHFQLGLKSALFFAVPVPKENAMNSNEINKVIDQAVLSANEKGISGKEITPYLLAEISKITKGSSLQTNIALIINNARVAADIAVELTKLKSDSNGNIQESGKYEVNADVGNKPVSLEGRQKPGHT